MWDGFFFLVNGRVWAKLPANLQEIIARNINAGALKEQEDMVKLNSTSEGKLRAAGMVFNKTDPAAFRAVLSKAGYYKDWKATFGADAWSRLEKYTGPLA